MNAFLETWSRAWADWALAASWQIAVLVVLVAIAAFMSRRLSARFRYLLWMLVIIKALTPPSFGTAWSIGNFAPSWGKVSVTIAAAPEKQEPIGAASAKAVVHENGNFENDGKNGNDGTHGAHGTYAATENVIAVQQAVRAPAPMSMAAILLVVWAVGFVGLMGFIVYRYRRLTRMLSGAAEVDEGPLRVMLEKLALSLNRNNPPDLLLSDAVTSPFLFGILRPRIVLPADLPNQLNSGQIEDVLLHELIHWRRRDLLSGWLQILVQALFWFHPLVWLAGAQLRHERECACDEAALESGCSQARRYGESLLKVLLAARGRSAVAMGFLGIFERNTRLQSRLEEIMNQETRVRRLKWWGWVSLAVFAILCLPMAALSQNGGDDVNLTPLHQAAAGGHLETVKKLLGKGADVSAKTQNGRNPLHFAAMGGHMQTAETIITAGADVNARDDHGNTPLSLAAANGHNGTAEMLIAKGAEVNPASVDEAEIREVIDVFLENLITNWDAAISCLTPSYQKKINLGYIGEKDKERFRGIKIDRVIRIGQSALAVTAPFEKPDGRPGVKYFGKFKLIKTDSRWLIDGIPGAMPFESGSVEREIESYKRKLERSFTSAEERQKENPKYVRVVLGEKGEMTFEGQPTTIEDLPKQLEKVPDRPNTVLTFAVASDKMMPQGKDIPPRDFIGSLPEAVRNAFGRITKLSREFGFKNPSFIGVHPLGSYGIDESQWEPSLRTILRIDRQKNPDGSDWNIQSAVFAICYPTGMPFLNDKSVSTSPEMGELIQQKVSRQLNLRDVTAEQALIDLLNPVGLRFNLDENGLYLYKPASAADSAHAQETRQKMDLASYAQALEMFEVDNRRYPSTAEGLAALVDRPEGISEKGWRGPYIKATRQGIGRDAWGRALKYESPASDGRVFALISAGPDGKFGTDDDITNKETQQSRGQTESGTVPFAVPERPNDHFEAGALVTMPTIDGRLRVSALRQWSDTGIDVKAGDAIDFRAEGTVYGAKNNGWPSGPDGVERENKRFYALIGKVVGPNHTQQFLVSNKHGNRIGQDGRLYLGVSDTVHLDNSGEFQVAVKINGTQVGIEAQGYHPLKKPTGNLLDLMFPVNGATIEKTSDGVVVRADESADCPRIRTRNLFKPPISIHVRAKTDSTNIRIYYGAFGWGQLIFNWEQEPSQLRVHDHASMGAHPVKGQGSVTANEWHDFVWEIQPDQMRIMVDGKLRYECKGNYGDQIAPVGIGPAKGSVVTVQTVEVAPLGQKPEPSFEAPIEFDKDIPVDLQIGMPGHPRMLWCKNIRFSSTTDDRQQTSINGKLKVGYLSGPKAKWIIHVGLLDSFARVIASNSFDLENSGKIAGLPVEEEKTFEAAFGLGQLKAAKFRVFISQIQAESGTGNVATPPPAQSGVNSDWKTKLNPDQLAFVNWTESFFDRFLDRRDFSTWSTQERDAELQRCLNLLGGPQERPYYNAINTLGAIGDARAVKPLLAVATDKVGRDARDNWMAVRALGMIGDKSAVPDLIHLTYFGNANVHLWAQVSLVRLTGQNFGYDWKKWGEWWNAQGGQPPVTFEKVRWFDDPNYDERTTPEALQKQDQKFLDDIAPNRPGRVSQNIEPGTQHSALPNKFPNWSAMQATGAPDTMQAGDIPTAWASLEPDQGEQWLELEYYPSIRANMVRIHETFNPGAVTKLILYESTAAGIKPTEVPVTDNTDTAPAFFEPQFPLTQNPVTHVRVVLDTNKVPGWNEIDAVELVGPDGRVWARDARASSSYADRFKKLPPAGAPAFSALQAVGDPDLTGDDSPNPAAWAPLKPEMGEQWLELDYNPPMHASLIRIKEAGNLGAVTRITLKDSSGNVVADLPVNDNSNLSPPFLEMECPNSGTPVATVRIVLDTDKVRGWNEIDAVQLGGPNGTAWATNARASSSYADRLKSSPVPAPAESKSDEQPGLASYFQTPRIVSISPAIGATHVDSNTSEIVVTFDRIMDTRGYSWTGGGPNFPKTPEGKRPFWRDARTCVMPVALEPARYYRLGINATSYQNFQSKDGVPVDPVSIYFTTNNAPSSEAAKLKKPQIVSMVPPNGATDVDSNLKEIRVTFDVAMGSGFSWVGGGEDYPETSESARWSDDRKTCILPVTLKPGHDYRLGLNSVSFQNFTSENGVPLDPVDYTFRTRE